MRSVRYRVLAITASTLLASLLLAACASAPRAPAAPAFRIGVVTGTAELTPGERLGAELLVAAYGDAASGGLIAARTYSATYGRGSGTVMEPVLELARDPLVKAIVVAQAIPGTAEAFARVRELRPDLLLLAGEAHEDPLEIAAAADLVVWLDYIARGYTIPWAARELGARTFVHVSFDRHMSYETLALRRKIMEAACAELGLSFAFEEAVDPIGDNGIAGAREFIRLNLPAWIARYGRDAAFFSTNDALVAPLVAGLLAHGGIFVEADLATVTLGYPPALGLDAPDDPAAYAETLAAVERAVVESGGAGRFGVFAHEYGSSLLFGLAGYAIAFAEGSVGRHDGDALARFLAKGTPGASWRAVPYAGAYTGERFGNAFLVHPDTYVLGRGFLRTASVPVPEELFRIILP